MPPPAGSLPDFSLYSTTPGSELLRQVRMKDPPLSVARPLPRQAGPQEGPGRAGLPLTPPEQLGRPGTHLGGLVGVLQVQVLGKHHLSLSTAALPNVHPGQHLVSRQLLVGEQLQGEREGHVHLAGTMQRSPEAAGGRGSFCPALPPTAPQAPQGRSKAMPAQPAGPWPARPGPALQRASVGFPTPTQSPDRRMRPTDTAPLWAWHPAPPDEAVPAPGSGGAGGRRRQTVLGALA